MIAGVSVADVVHVETHEPGVTECRPGIVLSVGTLSPGHCRIRVIMPSASIGPVGEHDSEASYPPAWARVAWDNPDGSQRVADSWHHRIDCPR